VVFGYWPKDGIAKADPDVEWRDNGFDSAVNFPTASSGQVPRAKGFIRFVAQPSNGETITLGTTQQNITVFTFKNSPSEATDIQIGANEDATATNTKSVLDSYFSSTLNSNIESGFILHLTGTTENIPILENVSDGLFAVSGFSDGDNKGEGLVGVTS